MESVVLDSVQVAYRIELIEAYKSAIGSVIAYVWVAAVGFLLFCGLSGFGMSDAK